LLRYRVALPYASGRPTQRPPLKKGCPCKKDRACFYSWMHVYLKKNLLKVERILRDQHQIKMRLKRLGGKRKGVLLTPAQIHLQTSIPSWYIAKLAFDWGFDCFPSAVSKNALRSAIMLVVSEGYSLDQAVKISGFNRQYLSNAVKKDGWVPYRVWGKNNMLFISKPLIQKRLSRWTEKMDPQNTLIGGDDGRQDLRPFSPKPRPKTRGKYKTKASAIHYLVHERFAGNEGLPAGSDSVAGTGDGTPSPPKDSA
jgi:hypothetical protein